MQINKVIFNNFMRANNPLNIIFLVFVFFILSCFVLFQSSFYQAKLHVVTSGIEKNDTIQFFYLDNSHGFSEENSQECQIKNSKISSCDFNVPSNTSRIRIDIGTKPNTVILLDASYESKGVKVDLENAIDKSSINQVSLSNFEGHTVIESSGSDPYFLFHYDFLDSQNNLKDKLFKTIIASILFSVLFVFFIKAFRLNRAFFVVIVLSVLIRVCFFYIISPPNEYNDLYRVFFDEGTYNVYIQKLFSMGLRAYFNSESSVEVAPGTLLWHGALLYAFNGSILMVRFFNLLFFTNLISWNIYSITNEFFTNKNSRNEFLMVLPVALFSIYFQVVYFASSMLTDLLFLTLFTTFVLSMVKLLNGNELKYSKIWLFISIISASWAMLTRYVLMPFMVCIIVYGVFIFFKKDTVKAYRLISVGLLSLVVISPFIFHGYKYIGEPTVATGSGAVLWLGTRLDTNGDEPPYYGKQYNTNDITKGLSHISIEGDKRLKKAAVDNIKAYPIKYIMLSIKRVGRLVVGSNNFWFFPQKNLVQYLKPNGYLMALYTSLSIVIVSFVSVFSLGYVLMNIRYVKEREWFLVVLALYMVAIYVPFLVNQRYGLPVFFINSILCIGAIVSEHTKKMHLIMMSTISMVVSLYVLIGF